jgi:hypothetical protein
VRVEEGVDGVQRPPHLQKLLEGPAVQHRQLRLPEVNKGVNKGDMGDILVLALFRGCF